MVRKLGMPRDPETGLCSTACVGLRSRLLYKAYDTFNKPLDISTEAIIILHLFQERYGAGEFRIDVDAYLLDFQAVERWAYAWHLQDCYASASTLSV